MAGLFSISPAAILGVQGFTTDATLNNHGYDWELYFINSTGNALQVPPTALRELTIEETLANWVTRGSITVNFDNELAESWSTFIFRNDGEDVLRFRLLPKNDNFYASLGADLKIDPKLWELNYIFSIYDIQDVSPQTRSNTDASAITKLKKFLFWDVRYQLLISRNLEYSTAQSAEAAINQGVASGMSTDMYRDENRAIGTDVAIDEIIKAAFNGDSVLGATGRDNDPGENWDTGLTKLFYTSGSCETAYDDLMYAFSRHVSSQEKAQGLPDTSILSIEHTDTRGIGVFAIRPLSRYFENAGSSSPGKYQLEHFFLKPNIQADGESAGGKQFRAPILQGNDMRRDIKINDYNIIDKYEFVDISPIINTAGFTSRPVYSFDFKNRTYNVDFQRNSLVAAEQMFTEAYIDKLYKRNTSNANNFLLKTNTPTKVINSNVMPVFSLYGDRDTPELRVADGLHKILKTGLFQNTCINFVVPGLSFRKAGMFIGIDRQHGSVDNSLDDKLCGQWFVINVLHTFSGGMYYNTITAVKIHRFNPMAFDINTQPGDVRLDGSRGGGTQRALPFLDGRNIFSNINNIGNAARGFGLL